jgi:hypothetical protein
MRDGTLPSRPVFSMNFELNRGRGHPLTKGIIAVWEEGYKLIHYLTTGKSKLSNLQNDPDELNDLFIKKPVKGQRLLSLIQDELKNANK